MTWRQFEKLAEQIYKELEPSAKVTHNDKILGQDSKIPRQIDVSIRHAIAGHDLLTIVQAKDYAEPADVNTVGEFATVIKDVRANKGVLICKSGFTSAAMTIAESYGIDLCNIHDAESRKWSLDIKLPILWIDYCPSIKVSINFDFRVGDVLENPKSWRIIIIEEGGRGYIGDMLMMDLFANPWNDGVIPRNFKDIGQNYDMKVDSKDFNLFIKDANDTLTYRKINKFEINYTVEKRCWYGFFTPEECRGILNYSSKKFLPSYLPIGSMPVKRDENWKQIDDPQKLAINMSEEIITTENWRMDIDDGEMEIINIDYNEKN
jgi:hypothetical protein